MTIFELAWGFVVAGNIRSDKRFFRDYDDAVKAAGELGCVVEDAETLMYNGEYAGSITAYNLE